MFDNVYDMFNRMTPVQVAKRIPWGRCEACVVVIKANGEYQLLASDSLSFEDKIGLINKFVSHFASPNG